MSKIDNPKLVVALFTFKGKNNDELCFRKGDVITITQMDDGGWWEGTLSDKTGWFPSNYVKEQKNSDSSHSSVKSSPEKTTQELAIQQRANRSVVLKDIIDSERANVAELQGLVNNFLKPLDTTGILTREEYKQLVGNILDVLEIHQHLLTSLEAACAQGSDARAGNLFLALAPRLKSIHIAYCASHPRAVCILDRFRDELNEFMEHCGAVTPGILVLTTGLSKPFRRLEKYSAMLQELERHMEKNHPDRGDTQRSVCVYREIAERCSAIRKQKELALTVLAGGIKGWEGEDLHTLGDIIYVGPVTLATGVDRRDRYFVLFSTTLLVLSTSQRMSSFVYEGKLPLTGIAVTKIDDTEDMKNGFEISGPMIESILAVCPSREERQQWIEYLTQEQRVNTAKSPSTMQHVSPLLNGKQPRMGVEGCLPPGIRSPWSIASLRPAPPLYSCKSFGKTDLLDAGGSMRIGNERMFEEDAIILRVIEGYCATVNTRLTVHSAMLECEAVHKACDKMSIMHNRVGNWDGSENRSLSETVNTLKEQIIDLQSQMVLLTRQLDDERKSRLSLAATVKRSIAVMDASVS
ncbi:rho guanine nucleotide exchange factor 7 isoform X1 [Neodiprion virginianus]|uniref:Rho guanine nucleotide exchange factor 7 isoform X1 n=2 Tax=Neodiprion lecontei TaxID=441921 RepID=A0A6J0BX96_NEOLC|nr:rho guanine nucleotide exchange factor 7 isoform X1 [Neodiprion lecontei]XP_046595594.1 rho guanine nucleotide exchange factor 7 isoform X1 [Neodiprion lecontei]XP_046595595.1 rho guanine nucleotide exchange factor 7 isoform X1 [Neodiprion lecontei]XP_046618241.1 rho guanine nucleotide exchange factor 7 isoform X1 [Neodiprion virginianus]XP_046618242.1 rho guanine nucleotide exchange factor 7 isoform X1 [Neodiprion virginianus]XP_046618243.1 rho guanine nucleotide exchange factor 7 isoform 